VGISIRVNEQEQRLVCTITDNGPGAPAGPVREGAFGLESVRRRLQLRYGDQGRLRLARGDGETVAKVELPMHAPPQPMAPAPSSASATREAS
jgi:LytS/YehU family sensor histidine kinase